MMCLMLLTLLFRPTAQLPAYEWVAVPIGIEAHAGVNVIAVAFPVGGGDGASPGRQLAWIVEFNRKGDPANLLQLSYMGAVCREPDS